MIEILSAQAEQFSLQGNHQDALFIYNQALSQATEDEKPQLIFNIEQVLSKTPAMEIEQFSTIKNINIPRSLLLYWMGLNYALEHNVIKSKQMLELFLSEYPAHPYYSDAEELVDVIKRSVFKSDTIGCLLPMTGKYAVFGQRALTGIQLAIQELSKEYSRDFKIIIQDTQADPEMAIEGVRRLHQKNVAGIIGPLLTVNEAGREAEKLEIPMIALTQKSDFPFQGEYLFANFITPEMQVQTLGAYLFQQLGLKKVAILYPDEKYGRKYMRLFSDIVEEYEGEIVGVEPYDGRATDFSESIQTLLEEQKPTDPEPITSTDADTEIKTDLGENEQVDEEKEEKIQIDFEALFIPDSPSRVNMILPQLAFNDATGMILVGTNLWHHKSILEGSKGYNSRAVITDGFFEDSTNFTTARFTKNYEALFHTKPKFLEAIAYDTASILFLTAMEESVDSRQMLKDALTGKRLFEGVTGKTIFDEDGTAHRELFLITIEKGKFVEINR